MNVREAACMLAVILDEKTFETGQGVVPSSIPYVALMNRGVDLATYQEALGILADAGLITLGPDTIRRGPKFEVLAPEIASAAEYILLDVVRQILPART